MSTTPASVLFDAPGPKTRRNQLVVGATLTVLALAFGAWVLWQFVQQDQFTAAKWTPFFEGEIWTEYLLPGLLGTLKAAAVSIVLAAAFGLVFGVGRLSHLAPVRWLCGAIVEILRSVPVLVMMIGFFNIYLFNGLFSGKEGFAAVVTALTLYNGSVVAELVRAGVENLPKGQREAGLSIGLTPSQTTRSILLPQALTAMLPAIMSQIVVVLKDTALGYVITYEELLNKANQIGSYKGNLIPAFVVVALLFIAINYLMTTLATALEGRLRRSGRSASLAVAPVEADLGVVTAQDEADARNAAGGQGGLH
ncbi:amino acid ABC transporter permease [Gephyromycinifex aptenodytis]|uniref:amino acid ABC transporter permease n=1 Tax=Gephyromycinifex aptenodytis TaxID=2716227 RepID=UPI001447A8B2|nr:amino acid ABC transporter permease [Gephyromycinifex aptenodytis]